MKPSAPSPPQAIQLKLYQAFIFSIPILFSIILFLLFYSAPAHLPTLQHEVKKILFDDCMKARDSLCCVCLGELEVKEEVLQVRACNHVDCIRHWLQNHSTCPGPFVEPVNYHPHRYSGSNIYISITSQGSTNASSLDN